jgi:hypothetical protein
MVVGAPTVKVNVRTYANVNPSMTMYQVPSNIAVCRVGLDKELASVARVFQRRPYHVDRNDVRSGVVGISEQKYSFSSGSTRIGTTVSVEHPKQIENQSKYTLKERNHTIKFRQKRKICG